MPAQYSDSVAPLFLSVFLADEMLWHLFTRLLQICYLCHLLSFLFLSS